MRNLVQTYNLVLKFFFKIGWGNKNDTGGYELKREYTGRKLLDPMLLSYDEREIVEGEGIKEIDTEALKDALKATERILNCIFTQTPIFALAPWTTDYMNEKKRFYMNFRVHIGKAWHK